MLACIIQNYWESEGKADKLLAFRIKQTYACDYISAVKINKVTQNQLMSYLENFIQQFILLIMSLLQRLLQSF